MKICVLGLGYVGAVSAGCLAMDGHEVIGVDPEPRKVGLINAGRTPIIEKDIGGIIERQVAAGRLTATTDVAAAIEHTDLSLVCVGTPSQRNGDIDLKYVRRVCEEIGAAMRHHYGAPAVVFRSTMLPGTMRDVVIPDCSRRLRASHAGIEFGVCINPEFLREGTAIHDYYQSAEDRDRRTEPGERRPAGRPVRRTCRPADPHRYRDRRDGQVRGQRLACAESRLRQRDRQSLQGDSRIDSHRVMDIFCQDTKLNLSPYYLKPGFAFGGSCLPKDVRALLYKAKTLDVALPILNSILPSNEQQIERGVRAVMRQGQASVSEFSASASRRAPTICAKARWWS